MSKKDCNSHNKSEFKYLVVIVVFCAMSAEKPVIRITKTLNFIKSKIITHS